MRNSSLVFANTIPRQGTEIYSLHCSSFHCCLQILFPVRGRKQYTSFCKLSFYRFANTIPRQGTETLIFFLFIISPPSVCKYYSPSGDGNFIIGIVHSLIYSFANTIPRQGTETVFVPIFYGNYVTDSLQILFPVRGRSPYTIFYFYLRRQKMNFVYFIFYHLIRELFWKTSSYKR